MVSGTVNRDCQGAGTPRPQESTYSDLYDWDRAYEARQKLRAEAYAKAENDALIAAVEVNRSRRRTSWREAVALRVAAGWVLPANVGRSL
jgi:hypothetical protein